MQRAFAALLALVLTGCGAHSIPVQDNSSDSVLDNVADLALDLPWTMVDPTYRFAARSPARSLTVPVALYGAELGYFDEPQMLAQFSARQGAAMAADKAGFTASLDLDRDRMPETYRVGFWRRGDSDGTFIAAFEDGQLKDLQQMQSDEWFLSWHGGALVVSGCNCPHQGEITFEHDRLNLRWSD